MKNIKYIISTHIMPLIIVFIILFAAYSTDKDSREYYKNSNIKLENPGRWFDVEKINFDNHSYIIFKNKWNSSGDAILHDPDCECMKINKAE